MRNFVKWNTLSFVLGFFISCTISDSFPPTPPPLPPTFFTPTTKDPSVSTQDKPGSFPFELIPDTLTAATCDNSFNVSGSNFVLSLGAYRNHGLRLSQAFVQENHIQSNTPFQRIRSLLDKSAFKTAKARFALQNESNLNMIFRTGEKEIAIAQLFPPFDNPSVLDNLSQKRAVFTTRSSDYQSVQGGGKFEARLPITGKTLRAIAPGLAPKTQGNYILTLTYINQGTKLILSGKGTPYGRGYKITFANYNTDYLRDVREENLVTTQEEGVWSCPSKLVFPILRSTSEISNPFNNRYQHFSNKIPTGTKKEAYCDTQNSRLSTVERDFFLRVFGTDRIPLLPFHFGKVVFPDESSSSRSSRSCIVPKRGSCYDNSSQYYRIEFNDYCVPWNNLQVNDDRYRVCPSFLSTCYRR